MSVILFRIRSEDFEEINFDDDNLTQCEEGMAIETVILPEETSVPATSTCPCDCHSDAQNVTYHTKVRHCRKCCIKVKISHAVCCIVPYAIKSRIRNCLQ